MNSPIDPSHLSFQWKNIYREKYPTDGFSCILPTNMFLFCKNILSMDTHIRIKCTNNHFVSILIFCRQIYLYFNKLISHLNNQTWLLTCIDSEATMTLNNQYNICRQKHAKKMVQSIERDFKFFFKLFSIIEFYFVFSRT